MQVTIIMGIPEDPFKIGAPCWSWDAGKKKKKKKKKRSLVSPVYICGIDTESRSKQNSQVQICQKQLFNKRWTWQDCREIVLYSVLKSVHRGLSDGSALYRPHDITLILLNAAANTCFWAFGPLSTSSFKALDFVIVFSIEWNKAMMNECVLCRKPIRGTFLKYQQWVHVGTMFKNKIPACFTRTQAVTIG